jgi:antitoxin YefM
MKTLTLDEAQKEWPKILEDCLASHQRFRLKTAKGNAILLSEEDYKSLCSSLALAQIPGVYADVKEGIDIPEEKLVPWDQVKH